MSAEKPDHITLGSAVASPHKKQRCSWAVMTIPDFSIREGSGPVITERDLVRTVSTGASSPHSAAHALMLSDHPHGHLERHQRRARGYGRELVVREARHVVVGQSADRPHETIVPIPFD